VAEFMHLSIVFYSTCMMLSYRKFTSAILSPDEFLVWLWCAGSVFAGRSWQGLDPQLGKTPVHTAVQGSVGLAMAYSHEPHDNEHQNTDS